MKKLILLLLFSLFGCYSNKGEIKNIPTDFIIIHNKTYKLMRVVPCDLCEPIWIMYPKDSIDSQPQVINYNVSRGKNVVNNTIIKVD